MLTPSDFETTRAILARVDGPVASPGRRKISMTMNELSNRVNKELESLVEEDADNAHDEDLVREVAYKHVPKRNADLVGMLKADLTLGYSYQVPDFEGDPNAFDLIAWTIQRRLMARADENLEPLRETAADDSAA